MLRASNWDSRYSRILIYNYKKRRRCLNDLTIETSADAIMRSVIVAILYLSLTLASAKVTYDGFKVLRTQHLNMTTAKLLRELQMQDQLDFWQDPMIGRSADIMASPEMLSNLQQFLNEYGIHYTVMIEDVEELHRSNKRKQKKSMSGYDWDDYYGHVRYT